MQAYVEDSDSEHGSTLVEFSLSRSPSHVTTGSQKEGKEKEGDEGESKCAR